ncbi:unnamed protein product (macronuclear) [Paramecium tetraurelia]|uniref:Uncharacterized protein n=1 Tax=Paramecium tetraurelia TaxID=5888 RepID=A0CIL1_PARTE|nr:uncharacterized protein GSPATT00007763001 [Paramecium tetraurelia]CAK70628.1 unnamed protein product [Paramecium tetraurelia]|eukprot:XP_001438025.1 hypothetical protein (macronuclear) [Paramecium tetraurelia strain d4-2]
MQYLQPVLCTEQPAEESILLQFNQSSQAKAALQSPILQNENYFINSANKDLIKLHDTNKGKGRVIVDPILSYKTFYSFNYEEAKILDKVFENSFQPNK